VIQSAWAVDTNTIDRNSVAATQVFDDDRIRPDMKQRVLSRHESVR